MNTSPSSQEFSCKLVFAVAERSHARTTALHSFLTWNKQQPETYLAESCNHGPANPMEWPLIFRWVISLKITLLWSTSGFSNIALRPNYFKRFAKCSKNHVYADTSNYLTQKNIIKAEWNRLVGILLLLVMHSTYLTGLLWGKLSDFEKCLELLEGKALHKCKNNNNKKLFV